MANGSNNINDLAELSSNNEKIISISNLPSTTYSRSFTNNLPTITSNNTEITAKKE